MKKDPLVQVILDRINELTTLCLKSNRKTITNPKNGK